MRRRLPPAALPPRSLRATRLRSQRRTRPTRSRASGTRSDAPAAGETAAPHQAALLARDEKAVASMYAVPSLILFPGNPILVTDARQTEEFFAASWSQYDGVDSVERQLVVMGKAPGTVWADVTWSYGGGPRERFCYQLVDGADGVQIAVLTPMELAPR